MYGKIYMSFLFSGRTNKNAEAVTPRHNKKLNNNNKED